MSVTLWAFVHDVYTVWISWKICYVYEYDYMKFLKLGVLINFIMKLERVRNLKHYLIYFSFL